MAARTRSRVRCEMGRLPLITYDTVLWETPATRATSLLVNAGIKHLLEARRYVSLIRPQRNECPFREQDMHWSRFGNDGVRPLFVDFQGRTGLDGRRPVHVRPGRARGACARRR